MTGLGAKDVPRCAGLRAGRREWRGRRRGCAALALEKFYKGGDGLWSRPLRVGLSSDRVPVLAC